MSWKPFGAKEESETLVDGVPPYMVNSVIDWMGQAELLLCYDENYYSCFDELKLDSRRRRSLVSEFDRKSRLDSYLYDANTKSYFRVKEHMNRIGLMYLDYLIEKLDELREDYDSSLVSGRMPIDSTVEYLYEDLEKILSESGSKWRLGKRNGYCGLEERVSPMMQQIADELVESKSSASQLLSDSWHSMFGRNPDYSKAYATAVKSVEAVVLPIVEPNNKKSTLSKAAAVMRDQKWSFQIETNPKNNVNGGVIQLLMSALMYSHSDRHGSGDGVITEEKAKAAVFSAVFLVQIFSSGLVTRGEKA